MGDIDWNALLSNGLTSAIDGHFDKEAAKHQKPTEQIKPAVETPQTTSVAVQGAMSQNNIMIAGVPVNKTIGIISGTLLVAALLYKAIK